MASGSSFHDTALGERFAERLWPDRVSEIGMGNGGSEQPITVGKRKEEHKAPAERGLKV
jgi:hypothetical protein